MADSISMDEEIRREELTDKEFQKRFIAMISVRPETSRYPWMYLSKKEIFEFLQCGLPVSRHQQPYLATRERVFTYSSHANLDPLEKFPDHVPSNFMNVMPSERRTTPDEKAYIEQHHIIPYRTLRVRMLHALCLPWTPATAYLFEHNTEALTTLLLCLQKVYGLSIPSDLCRVICEFWCYRLS